LATYSHFIQHLRQAGRKNVPMSARINRNLLLDFRLSPLFAAPEPTIDLRVGLGTVLGERSMETELWSVAFSSCVGTFRLILSSAMKSSMLLRLARDHVAELHLQEVQ
jgi:hypothetical protein